MGSEIAFKLHVALKYLYISHLRELRLVRYYFRAFPEASGAQYNFQNCMMIYERCCNEMKFCAYLMRVRSMFMSARDERGVLFYYLVTLETKAPANGELGKLDYTLINRPAAFLF